MSVTPKGIPRTITREDSVRSVLESNSEEAFSLVCRYNPELQIVDEADASTFIKSRNDLLQRTILTSIGAATVTGLLSYKLIPGNSIWKNLGVVSLTGIAFCLGHLSQHGTGRKEREDIMRRYPSWNSNPKVFQFLLYKNY